MMRILHIDCSPRAASYSRRLSASVVSRLLTLDEAAAVRRRDLGLQPINHIDGEHASALATIESAAAPGHRAMSLSDALIAEVEEADVIVIGTPVNNFTVPSVLKAWIDQVVRVGRTMRSTPTGKVGLLHDRPVIVAAASGGLFYGIDARQPDFFTTYLSAVLGCIGLTSLHFLPLQGTGFIGDERASLRLEELAGEIDAELLGRLRVPPWRAGRGASTVERQ